MGVVVSSVIIVSGVGLFIGIFLGVAGEKFSVYVDPKEQEVLEALPGLNCGACGFPGCSGLAGAIVAGSAECTGCPVGGSSVAQKLAEIMGQTAGEMEKKVAFVMCKGTPQRSPQKYEYYGIQDCKMAAFVPAGGPKSCSFGCVGFGNCVRVCPFDAIHMVDGIARVDKDKCTACNKCIVECPKNIIELVPYKKKILVGCNNRDRGKEAKDVCSVACISCKMCERACKYDAIHVEDNIAHIDYSKCVMCGDCVDVCPSKIIIKQKRVVKVVV